ncbi:MAG: hypothetical protein NC253_08700 [Ruminococcus sp.]|nr:hypothetical protein [Ruminococcus sp.]
MAAIKRQRNDKEVTNKRQHYKKKKKKEKKKKRENMENEQLLHGEILNKCIQKRLHLKVKCAIIEDRE